MLQTANVRHNIVVHIIVLTVNLKKQKGKHNTELHKTTQSYSAVHTTTEHKTQNTEQHDRDAQCRATQ